MNRRDEHGQGTRRDLSPAAVDALATEYDVPVDAVEAIAEAIHPR